MLCSHLSVSHSVEEGLIILYLDDHKIELSYECAEELADRILEFIAEVGE